MTRIAYVYLPSFALQALLRGDPELSQAPLAVTDGTQVIEASRAARKLGLRPGLTVAQARGIAPEARLLPRAPELERAARSALEDLGAAFSPRVEPQPHGDEAAVAFDVSDLGRLFDHEEQLAAAIDAGARKLKLTARLGIARDKTTARVAALANTGVSLVPAGREAPFLAQLPVELLGPSDHTRTLLSRWGVRRIGELASLPSGGVAVRLGKEGARLAQVARGEADDLLEPRPEPLVFEEGLGLEWPIEDAEALAFVLRRLVDDLLTRLGFRSLAAGALELTLKLDRALCDAQALAGGALDVRTIPLAAPTREAPTLLSLTRADLERRPPPAPVTGVIVRAHAARARPAQLGLFEPAGPSPDKLATLLARLHALVGAGRVGAPALVDRHLPDAFSVQPFQPPKATPRTSINDAAAPALRPLALHAFRPPRIAEARLDAGRLRWLSAEGLGGQVIAQAGPFRLRDGWWLGPLAVARDYYDVELSDGAVYRVFHDLRGGEWLVEGCYE